MFKLKTTKLELYLRITRKKIEDVQITTLKYVLRFVAIKYSNYDFLLEKGKKFVVI